MSKGLISSIMNIRNNGLEISINRIKATASFLNIPSQFKEKRSKIIKRHFDDSPNDEPKLNAEQELKRECNKLFNMKSEDVLKWSKDLAMKYSEDLNGFDLYSE
ncbi:hypothetical protein QTP88_014702 [Uroleucon formosanum]